MSHRERRPRPNTWCPRGDSPLWFSDSSSGASPLPTLGTAGLPPPVASPRSTPQPYKHRRLSIGTDSPCGSPIPRNHPHHHAPNCSGQPISVSLQLPYQKQQQQQHLQHQHSTEHQNSYPHKENGEHQHYCNSNGGLSNSSSSGQPFSNHHHQKQQQPTVNHHQPPGSENHSQVHYGGSTQNSGVFYPMPQHPISPPPTTHAQRQVRFFIFSSLKENFTILIYTYFFNTT